MCESPATNLTGSPYHFDTIVRAIGAAAVAPQPPSSTVTTTTIGRAGSPTKHAYHDWSLGRLLRCAVPVFSNTGKRFWFQLF